MTYPLMGSPIASNTSLLVQRAVPYSQTTNVANQTAYPISTQVALDTLCFELQQIVCRTGQFRGVWVSGIQYNFGDIVQDGINGSNTNNFYLGALPNISSVSWANDLAAGDWSIAFNVQQLNGLIGAYLPLAGGTVAGNLTVSGNATLAVATAPTQAPGNNTTLLANTAFVQAAVSASASPVATGTITEFAGFTAPAGYLLCYGQAVSRATYATLFAALSISTTGNTHTTTIIDNIPSTTGMVAGMPVSGTNIPASTTIFSVDSGTQITLSQAAIGSTVGGVVVVAPHGVGDGTTTFNIPDRRGVVAAGVDNMGGSAANKITSVVSGLSGVRLGALGGDQAMQSHTHTASVTDPTHTHSGTVGSTTFLPAGGSGSATPYSAQAIVAAATGVTVSNSTTGAGATQNVQPTIMANFIIKT